MMSDNDEFNVLAVKEKVAQTLRQNPNDPESSRQIFLEEIMDWSDYFTENFGAPSSNHYNQENKNLSRDKIFNSIVELWLECAAFEVTLRQFKKAVEIYDKAVSDPIVSSALRIHLSYADFCIERGKLANARKIYVKAIQLPFSDTDRSNLWNQFLNLMHKINKSDELTIDQLFLAVQQQLLATASADSSAPSVVPLIPPPSIACSSTPDHHSILLHVPTTVSSPTIAVPSKSALDKPVLPPSQHLSATGGPSTTTFPPSTIATPVQPPQQLQSRSEAESKETVEVASVAVTTTTAASSAPPATVGDDLDSVQGLTPEVVVKMFNRRPPMIFTALNREPMMSGLRCLDSSMVKELEAFFAGISLASIESSVGGEEFDHHQQQKQHKQGAVDACLDLLESLWAAQALKERHFDSWMADLQRVHAREDAEFRQSLQEKSDRPGAEVEYKRFVSRCHVQKELLHSIINKTMFAMLVEQQTALAEIGFPRFNLPFLENLQRTAGNFLKTSSSSSTTSSTSSSSSSAAVVQSELSAEVLETLAQQRRLVCGFLSLRLFAVSEERSKLQAAANRLRVTSTSHRAAAGAASSGISVGGSGGSSSGGTSSLFRDTTQRTTNPSSSNGKDHLPSLAMSLDEDNNNSDLLLPMELSPESPASSSDAGMDYYSQEAKKKRRKRRLSVATTSFSNNASRNGNDTASGEGVMGDTNRMMVSSSSDGEEVAAYHHTTNEDSYRQSSSNSSINNFSMMANSSQSQFSNRYGHVVYIDDNNASLSAAQQPHQLHHHQQQQEEDVLKLPLLQKLAVMLKQQQGQGHQ